MGIPHRVPTTDGEVFARRFGSSACQTASGQGYDDALTPALFSTPPEAHARQQRQMPDCFIKWNIKGKRHERSSYRTRVMSGERYVAASS